MTQNRDKMSSIIKIEQEEKLSKEQVKFNTLIARIEKCKDELKKIQGKMDEGRKVVSEVLIPLERKHSDALKKYVLQLDKLYDLSFFGETEKEKIEFLIIEHLQPLIMEFPEDPELQRMDNKYYPDDVMEDAADMISDMLYDVFGVDLDPDDILDEDKLKEKLQEHQEQVNILDDLDTKPKKKSAAQKKKEEAKKKEAFHIGKAVKQIYTDLVKKLHPDREMDETLRDEKTEVMKKITIAYKENNFLTLLHFHQEYMAGTDRHKLDEMSDKQLKYYNKLLQEQSMDIKREIDKIKYSDETKNVYNLISGAEKTKVAKINREQNRLAKQIKDVRELFRITENKSVFRGYLKTVRINDDIRACS